MVSIRITVFSSILFLAMGAAAAEPKPLELHVPTFSPNDFEYSLHASSSNKHIGSCHITLLTTKSIAYPVDHSYKCSKKTKFCKAKGPGAKQAFINNCSILALGAPAIYVPTGYN